MMKRIAASDFHHFVPQQSSEKLEERNCYIPLNGTTGVNLSVRSVAPVQVSAIDTDGQTVFLEAGLIVNLSLRLDGFSALEIRATEPFAYQCDVPGKWWEIPDPQRLVVAVDEPASKPVDDLIREGIAKHLGKLAAQGILKDAELEELLDDVYNGEHEFEEEEDMFGLGHVEEDPETLKQMEEAQAARAARRRPAKPLADDDGPDDDSPPLPLEGGKNGPSKPAPKDRPDPDA